MATEEKVERLSADDEEILRFIESARPKIDVVGTGVEGTCQMVRVRLCTIVNFPKMMIMF